MRNVAMYSRLEHIPPRVGALLDECGREDFFLGTEWFRLLASHALPEGAVPRLYVVSDGDDIECVLVTVMVPRGRWYFPRQLDSLTNFYTIGYAPVLRRDLKDDRAPLEALVEFIAGERPRWSIIELRNLIAREHLTQRLLVEFRRHSFLASTYFQFDNWYEPTAGLSARDYFASRPSRVRNTITRKGKRLEREHKVDFHVYRTVEETKPALAHYHHVYARSWKLPEAYPDFIPSLVRIAAEKGILRLGVLSIDETPAAAQIWIVAGQRATIYKLAYDEAFAATSAGSILTKRMFDEILDKDDVREVDYGIGGEPYKLEWMGSRRQGVGLIAFNLRTLPGLFGAVRHVSGQQTRRWRRIPSPATRAEDVED